MMPLLLCLFLISLVLLPSAAFVRIENPRSSSRLAAKEPYKPTWSGDKGTPSYSDDWLLNFHNQAQSDKQLLTNSLAVWNENQEQEQQSIKEWQESFLRNGLADFTPPMSYGLNCLMVGGDINTDTNVPMDDDAPAAAPVVTKLPWEDEPEADITSLEIVVPEKMSTSASVGELPEGEDTEIIQTRLVSDSPNPTATGLRVPNTEAAVYDCIVDQGLMGSVLMTENSETVRELCLEASLALREHGIYVLHTKKLSPETIQLLESYGQEAGLEWQFNLDGISDDNAQVSVGRRFNTGEMPKVGRLSRYQP